MNNPLYNRVVKIVQAHEFDTRIRQTAFAGIHNQSSVRSVLNDLGYAADCIICPNIWRASKPPPQDFLDQNKNLKISRYMSTKRGAEVLDTLLDTGVFYVNCFSGGHSYLRRIIAEIKSLGYEVEPITRGKFVDGYTLKAQ